MEVPSEALLARHSTIDLTMNGNTTLTMTDHAAALNRLPGVPIAG